MGQVKEYEKRLIARATGQYTSMDNNEEIYDAYQKLVELEKNGKGEELASDHVQIWHVYEYEPISNMLNMINDSIKLIKSYNPIDYIDWDALKDQKEVLQSVKHSLSVEEADAIEGLLNLIDSIQDYGVDVLGYDEDIVLKLPNELIGYQVLNEDNDIHPKMANTFSIYSHSQAKEMIENSDDKNDWKIVPIYERDIENPEFMFEGYPEN